MRDGGETTPLRHCAIASSGEFILNPPCVMQRASGAPHIERRGIELARGSFTGRESPGQLSAAIFMQCLRERAGFAARTGPPFAPLAHARLSAEKPWQS